MRTVLDPKSRPRTGVDEAQRAPAHDTCQTYWIEASAFCMTGDLGEIRFAIAAGLDHAKGEGSQRKMPGTI